MNAGTGTGGSNTHTLTVAEMPSHAHVLNRYNGIDDSNFSGHKAGGVAANDTSTQDMTDMDSNTQYTGGSGSHNNMPAYQEVYA